MTGAFAAKMAFVQINWIKEQRDINKKIISKKIHNFLKRLDFKIHAVNQFFFSNYMEGVRAGEPNFLAMLSHAVADVAVVSKFGKNKLEYFFSDGNLYYVGKDTVNELDVLLSALSEFCEYLDSYDIRKENNFPYKHDFFILYFENLRNILVAIGVVLNKPSKENGRLSSLINLESLMGFVNENPDKVKDWHKYVARWAQEKFGLPPPFPDLNLDEEGLKSPSATPARQAHSPADIS